MWFWLVMLGWVAAVAAFALNRSLALSSSKRFVIYLVGVPAVGIAGWLVVDSFASCPAEATDCDLVGLASTFTGVFVVLVGFGSAIVFETIRAFLSSAKRSEQR